MRLILMLLASVAALSGCETVPREIPPSIECPRGLNGACDFADAPVPVSAPNERLPNRPYAFSRTLAPLTFVDATNRRWVAPARTLTDGASIPPIFVHIVGDPRRPEFLSAAVIHDAYCGIGNETLATYQTQSWQTTHEMFYDALISSGTEPLRAKIMFAAVYLGGPRWPGDSSEALAFAPSYRGLPRTYSFRRDLSRVPYDRMVQVMYRVKRYIETAQPTPNRVEIRRYIDSLERRYLWPARDDLLRDDPPEADTSTISVPSVPEDPYDPYDPYDPSDPDGDGVDPNVLLLPEQ